MWLQRHSSTELRQLDSDIDQCRGQCRNWELWYPFHCHTMKSKLLSSQEFCESKQKHDRIYHHIILTKSAISSPWHRRIWLEKLLRPWILICQKREDVHTQKEERDSQNYRKSSRKRRNNEVFPRSWRISWVIFHTFLALGYSPTT